MSCWYTGTPPVTVKQWLYVRIFLGGGVKRIKNKPVVIAVAYGAGNNTFILEVESRAEVQLAAISALELRDVRKPFFVKFFGGKIAVKYILSRYPRRGFYVIRPLSADNRFHANGAHYTVDAFFIALGMKSALQTELHTAVFEYAARFLIKDTHIVNQLFIFGLLTAFGAATCSRMNG